MLKALVHNLLYLRSAPRWGILYKAHGHLLVETFADADYASSPIDRSPRIVCTFLETIL